MIDELTKFEFEKRTADFAIIYNVHDKLDRMVVQRLAQTSSAYFDLVGEELHLSATASEDLVQPIAMHGFDLEFMIKNSQVFLSTMPIAGQKTAAAFRWAHSHGMRMGLYYQRYAFGDNARIALYEETMQWLKQEKMDNHVALFTYWRELENWMEISSIPKGFFK